MLDADATTSTPRRFSLHDVNATGAGRIASVAAKAGVPRFVHVSHLNASLNSPSRFYQAKAEGDQLVQEAFPNATIVRPATMYGYEDRLLQNMAGWSYSKRMKDKRSNR